MTQLSLSIVDQGAVAEGRTSSRAIEESLALARFADCLGYQRYWFAEHHGAPCFASSAPEILMSRICRETSRIRIGSGGILLRHYSPLKVAEVFQMLSILAPNRIDLGVGRAVGGSDLETSALTSGRPLHSEWRASVAADTFTTKVAELLAYFDRDFPIAHPFSRIHVSPDCDSYPEVWLLGSSLDSADIAAGLGLPYCFSYSCDGTVIREAIYKYRSHFQSVRTLKTPHIIAALGVICADTDKDAEALASSFRVFRRRNHDGDVRPIPQVGESLRLLERGADAGPLHPKWLRYIIGSPETVRDELLHISSLLGINEFIIFTVIHNFDNRCRSYELLANVVFGNQEGNYANNNFAQTQL